MALVQLEVKLEKAPESQLDSQCCRLRRKDFGKKRKVGMEGADARALE